MFFDKIIQVPFKVPVAHYDITNYIKESLTKIKFPKLVKVGTDFLNFSESLIDLEMPKLISASHFFLAHNTTLKNFYAPRLKNVGGFFLED